MNYSLYCDAALRDVIEIIDVVGDSTHEEYDPVMEEHYRFCRKYLERAVKFKLPLMQEMDAFWQHFPGKDTLLYGKSEEDFKLPYPVMVLEYKQPRTDETEESDNIILAVETNSGGYRFYQLQNSPSKKQWVLSKSAFEVAFGDGYVNFIPLYSYSRPAEGIDADTMLAIGVYLVSSTIRCFLDAINCLNVEDKKISIPKSTLGQAKKKHKNYYDYRELVLVPTDRTVTRGEPTGVTRRTHLRRGHIRRLKSGKTVWVNATIVKPDAFEKGMVGKHYRV